ncbi:beta strand repeat-containing protein [Chelativorans multitrophicus]|uniref:beta strand repeat-containing protein n=1 Tax=Chelativorans multitrophicus TaxID=449973 RepID=UPI00140E4DB6|nr:hypothetical protein [Chelativorans multitrophicus]
MSFQFNESFYLTSNPDVFLAVATGQMASGLAHYNQFGWAEGRDPNANFDSSYYVSQNPDVAAAVLAGLFESPLQHFQLYGAAEGRAPSEAAAELLAYFDEAAYLAANPDVADAIADEHFANALEHYQLYGQFENRPGLPELPPVGETFDLTQGPDTGAAFTGGDGDDVYNAPAVQTGLLPIQTLNTADDIDGGAGRNTLNAQLVDPYVIPAGLWNIHEVNISSPGGITPIVLPNPTLDVLNANAIDTINFRNSTQSITINNLSTALNTVGIYDEIPATVFPFIPGPVAHIINHVGSATDGTNDALAIELRNATASTLTLNHASLAPNAGYEIFNIDSIGTLANVFTLVNGVGGPRDVTIAGNNALTINGISFNTLRTFDAVALMAPLVANFPGGSSAGDNVNITGTTFANTLTFTGTGTGAPGTGILTVTTFDGNDVLTFNGHTGDVVAALGEGDNTLASTGGNGAIEATAGAGDDTFTVDTHTGNVTIDGSDGNNVFNIGGTGTTPYSGPAALIGNVNGVVDLKGGDGDDTFNFYQVDNATNFKAGDSVDGGGGDNDLLRFDVFNATLVAVNLLVPGTTIANIETIRVTGDLFGDLAGVLNVDWANSGSANRLELAANALGVVNVTNLDFANGDTVAVYPIANTGIGTLLNLTLERGFVTAPAFNLELNDGVIVHILNVGTGSDLLNLASLGDPATDINSIFDASNINAGVVAITGDTDLLMGNSLANAFDQNNAVINLSDFTGNAFIGVNEGLQTINDGSGDDLFVVYQTGNGGLDRKIINLSADGGADTISFSDAFGGGGQLQQNHLVTGFDLAVDQVMLNLNGATTLFNQVQTPEATNGVAITNQDVVIREIEQGETSNLSASNINFLKFVAPAVGVDMVGAVDALFDAAIGAGQLNVNSAGAFFGAAYDSVAEAMVLFQITSADAIITATDTAEGIAVIEMSYDDFLAFDASNLYYDNAFLTA